MPLPYPVFADLDHEWRRFARRPETAAALAAWPASQPALAGYRTVDDILAGRRDLDWAPHVLTALVTLAESDTVAARVVLQAMLPGLVSLTMRLGDGDPDAGDHVLAIAWERIRTYGPRRNAAFTTNLLLDVRKGLLKERARQEPTPSLPLEVAPSAEEEALPHVFLAELAALEDKGMLPRGSTELLVRTRVEGHTLVELAAHREATGHALLQRRLRAEARLRRELDHDEAA